jgi:hypothetical protein
MKDLLIGFFKSECFIIFLAAAALFIAGVAGILAWRG